MKTIYKLMLALCLAFTGVKSYAYDFEVDGIYYNTDWQDNTIAIVTSGTNKYFGDIVIPETVKYQERTLKVTSIGLGAFWDCKELYSVSIPSSVKEIGYGAFYNCQHLESIVIPNSVTNLGDNVFSDCKSLKQIKLSTSISEIPSSAFQDCTSIESISFPENILKIGISAFWGCNELNSVDFSGNIAEIDDHCFSYCKGLTQITLPANLKRVGSNCFDGCNNLVTVQIADGVEVIGDQAFDNCAIGEITIPKSIKSIGHAPFSECKNLTNIFVSESNSFYCDIDGVLYSKDKKTLCFYPDGKGMSYVVPTGTEIIKDCAFYNSAISNLILNDELTQIGNEAFSKTKLNSIILPNSISELGNYLFGSKIPEFIISKINTPKDISPSVFEDSEYDPSDELYEKTILYVPSGTASLYHSAKGWKKFSHIKECDRVEVNGFEYEVSYGTHQATLLKKSFSVSFNEEVEIPEEISYQGNMIPVIGVAENAFKGTSLKSIAFSKNIQSIGQNALNGCSYLKTITVNMEMPIEIDENVFEGVYENATLIVPQTKKTVYSVTTPWNKFSKIKEIDGEIVVDGLLFEMDFSMGTAALLKKNTYVYSFDEIKIPETIIYQEKQFSVTGVAENAFRGTSLKSITFCKNIQSIGQNAFNGCRNLKTIIVNMEMPIDIDENVFEGVYENVTLIVPRGKRTIFAGIEPWSKFLPNIKEVDSEITDNGIVFEVDYLDKSAMVIGCNNIQNEIIIPEALTYDNELIPVQSIGKEAFKDDTRLRTIEIPKSIQTIGEKAFSNCTQLTTVISDIPLPIAIDDNVFEGVYSRAALIVPIGKGSAYTQANGWKDFKSIEEVKTEQDFTLDNLTFHAEFESKKASVIGYNGDDEYVEIPESFVKYGVKLEVREVAKSAFVNKSIRTISFPSTITRIAQAAFQNCHNLCALTWNSAEQFPSEVLTDINNPNLLLYLNSISAIPSGGSNYIVNGVADAISLSDSENGNFYCPQEFIANQIKYIHNYSMETVIGKSQGWETIVLPFDVQQIKSRSGNILPFAAVVNDNDRFFWLREMSEMGFTDAAEIKANKPYIISMPNSKWYSDVYRISGDVEFYSENVCVLASSELTGVINGSKTFMPTYQKIDANSNTYVLNVKDNSGDYAPGSVFVRNLRAIQPFECYIEDKVSQARAFYISDYATDIVNTSMASENDVIYLEGNTIVIESRIPQRIPIYKLSGQLVMLVNANTGRNKITGLNSGFYIIKGKKYVVM